MKATELRIGNWVAQNIAKKDFRVVGLNNKGAFISVEKDLDCIGINARNGLPCLYCYIDPIPLTDEWLVKFGFKNVDGYFSMENTLLRISNLNGFHCSLGDNDYGILFTIIKHVNQLQNLYFALTGEELNVVN